MKVSIGPYIASDKAKNKLLSMVPRSLESLLIKIPEEVVSKKLEGLLTIEFIMFS